MWLQKHWLGLSGLLLTALYIYLQLLQWQRHGDDLMLTAASILVTVILWSVLIVSIGRYSKASRRSSVPANADQTELERLRKQLQDETNAKMDREGRLEQVKLRVAELEAQAKQLPPVPTAPEDTDCVLPTRHKQLTLRDVWYAPSESESKDHYRDKVRFVIANSGEEIEVWTPLWESNDVVEMPPLMSRLTLIEEARGAKTDGAVEYSCLSLKPCQVFSGWIGLTQSHGEGLQVRLNRGTTGQLVFPLKIEGKLRYERVQI